MNIIITAFSLFLAAYIILLVLVVIGLRRLKLCTKISDEFISVVVAARNEEKRISGTLQSMSELDFPDDRFEVIWVDDASEDHTAQMIESFVSDNSNWRLIRLKEKSTRLRGKKQALKAAIEASRGPLIMTTDADCRVPPDWLKSMSACFDDETVMVLGHSPLKRGRGFLHKLLEFDNLFSAIVGAAPTAWGFPLTSVGRNLAYRKHAYQKAGGFEALQKFKSGDDVHLTERFRRLHLGNIRYCIDPGSYVETGLPKTSRELFFQQVRKNSKTLHKSLPAVLFSIALFAGYGAIMVLPLILPELLAFWAVLISIKVGGELLALIQAAKVFDKKYLLPSLPLMVLIYPFYIIMFSLLGSLQIYQWKK